MKPVMSLWHRRMPPSQTPHPRSRATTAALHKEYGPVGAGGPPPSGPRAGRTRGRTPMKLGRGEAHTPGKPLPKFRENRSARLVNTGKFLRGGPAEFVLPLLTICRA